MSGKQRPDFQEITSQRSELAEAITARIYGLKPEDWAQYGRKGRELSVRDVGYHLMYLTEALVADDLGLFIAYLDWANVLFANLKLPQDVLPVTLTHIRAVLVERLSPDVSGRACEFIDAGMRHLPLSPTTVPTFIPDDAPFVDLARDYLGALLSADRRSASRMVLEAVDTGVSVRDVYLHVFQPSQMEVGRLWQINRISVAQEHFCTAATQLVMSQLYPRIFATDRVGRSMVATCIAGELHEIGVRMVTDFLEMEGWDTYYLGASTPLESIVQTVEERGADVLAVSATMTYHISAVDSLLSRVRASSAQSVKVLVGGYPFQISPDLWRRLGADGCARDASTAVDAANAVLAEPAADPRDEE